jgi:exodeoxyribonuclease VII small subunit
MDKKRSYNEAVREIEEILARLGGEELDVDRMAAEVKRAAELIALCKEKLRKAEEEVSKIEIGD